jgi:hypothetical protein
MVTDVAGPSGGELGRAGRHDLDEDFVCREPGLARRLVTIGAHRRTGHDRARWDSIDWEDYRAHVGIGRRRGPWSVQAVQSKPATPDEWMSQAAELPWQPGWYTALVHQQRGLVMSDLPAEIAGCLPFLDRAARLWPARPADPRPLESHGAHLLIGGLGLGIVPAWLLANTDIWRIDIVEIDGDVIDLIMRDACARASWAASPRLHVYRGDIHTWRPAHHKSCALHTTCATWPETCWDAAWWDIYDVVSPGNLPSMRRLHRRFGRRVGWQMSWERPECEAMRRRGQTVEHPGFGDLTACHVLEDGYPRERP